MNSWPSEPRGPSAGDAAAGWQREPFDALPFQWPIAEPAIELLEASPPGRSPPGPAIGTAFRAAGSPNSIGQRVGGPPPSGLVGPVVRGRLPVLAPRSHHLEAARLQPRLMPLANPAPPGTRHFDLAGHEEDPSSIPLANALTPVLAGHKRRNLPQVVSTDAVGDTQPGSVEPPPRHRWGFGGSEVLQSAPVPAAPLAPTPPPRKRAGSESRGRSSSIQSSTGPSRGHGEGGSEPAMRSDANSEEVSVARGGTSPGSKRAGKRPGRSSRSRSVEEPGSPRSDVEGASAGLLQMRSALLERTSTLEAQLRKAQDEAEAEDARSQRLAYALAREAHRSEKMSQELQSLDVKRRGLETEWLGWSAKGGCGGLDLRTLELRAENDALREELRRLRTDSSQDEELAQLRSEAAFQEPLATKLQEDLTKADAEGETLRKALMVLLHGPDTDAETAVGDDITLQISLDVPN